MSSPVRRMRIGEHVQVAYAHVPRLRSSTVALVGSHRAMHPAFRAHAERRWIVSPSWGCRLCRPAVAMPVTLRTCGRPGAHVHRAWVFGGRGNRRLPRSLAFAGGIVLGRMERARTAAGARANRT